MTKLEYLKKAVGLKLYSEMSWIVSAFTITKKDSDIKTSLTAEPWGYSTNITGTDVKIDGTDSSKPLFSFKDKVTIDESWLPNVKESIETTVGNVIVNAICISYTFKGKYPFITGPIKVTEIDKNIALNLLSTPLDEVGNVDDKVIRKSDKFYVDEYISFVDSLQYLSNLSILVTWSATPKNIVAPPGITEFKKQLNEKYPDLTNPTALVNYEKELAEFDDNYLKDDHGYGTFMAGKIKNSSRKAMFLNLGTSSTFEVGFRSDAIRNSLEDGWSKDPDVIVNMMNSLRVGSYSRGIETARAGLAPKILLRVANNFKILDTDCKTALRLKVKITDYNIDNFIGRYVDTTLIEDRKFIESKVGKEISIRSPMYCTLEGDNICKYCVGDNINKHPGAIGILLTEISGIMLSSSLRVIHNVKSKTTKLNIDNAIT